MLRKTAPEKQGLYDPQFEKDSCGVGFVANIKGKRSHEIVSQALTVLDNLKHRGACGCEVNTGDGAGILLQVPHDFFVKTLQAQKVSLPAPGQYGVGMFYMPKNEKSRKACEAILEKIISEEGLRVLAWRDVPTDNSSLGPTAIASEPFMKQLFVDRPKQVEDDEHFERKLYILRRRAENAIRYNKSVVDGHIFYVSSFSSKTIVYKGMLTSDQVPLYYPELKSPDMTSALALVHSRFSTNTFPNWERAHPNRYVAHNGEINTLRGNVGWMNARQAQCQSPLYGTDIKKLFPIIQEDGSDSAMFDNCLEFLALSGRSLEHSVMMMIPEPWTGHDSMEAKRKAFYEYHSCLMEPWDGPASIAFTDGQKIGAILDRNGLRPSRYYVTSDDLVVMASEVGVLDIAPEKVIEKGRLQPGRMFLVDTKAGVIVDDLKLKSKIADEKPYGQWLKENLVSLDELADAPHVHEPDHATVLARQKVFGYTFEDLRKIIGPMGQLGVEPVGSMGTDTPLAVLSNKPQLLYSYFKQLFAQVTNPPIDSIREEIITSTYTMIGSEGNLLDPNAKNAHQILVKSPILSNEDFEKLRHVSHGDFKSVTLPILFDADKGAQGLEASMQSIFKKADEAIEAGANIIVLSDRGVSQQKAPIPALLAVSGVHHHLIRQGTRTKVGLILESGEPREVHHFALLIGYGVGAINPYLAFETLDDLIHQGIITGVDHKTAVKNFAKAVTKGVVKTMAKMGISTIQSYRGAQIFEAVGLNKKFVDDYFTWTATRIEGVGLEQITREALLRHAHAYAMRSGEPETLDIGGHYQWKKEGEFHLFNPESVHKLQLACRTKNYQVYQEYAKLINDQAKNLCTLRGLFELDTQKPIPIEEVESIESIVKRFKTGAMSYGSISKEAHEALAIAMNRLGGKSNTGEGGEDPERFVPMSNGDSKNSAIKQVASGRFGVTSQYLVNAREIQIKMAQGAKPGEGGQLPGQKVYPWIAKVRMSTPGVGLISPPPHHDIYSIEDLAELIYDLKNANHHARISVKLVSEVGVGTIAAGVAKAHADVVLISGHDGGTGASPLSSIKNAGGPWELGLAETHQTLVLNNLRSRIIVETDGQLKTGRDVVVAALLGAEEFGFATAPLVTLGCIVMRVCHLNTCPVGVATQDPELRKKFMGDPEYVVNFFMFIAQEVRQLMAELGFRTLNEMIGRTDKLKVNNAILHWKSKGLDLSPILYRPTVDKSVGLYHQMDQDHGIADCFDMKVLLKACRDALEKAKKVKVEFKISNVHRAAGTILGSELTRRYGAQGLPEDTIDIKLSGSAGQSLGAFVPKGIRIELEGDANDYFGKGLSGGKLIIYPPKNSKFKAEQNIIIGNVAFYGASSGHAYIAGVAGERFCVRNSGVEAVVEGVGDHGCEYMTGGIAVVLGSTGRNFAAGMSGGVAYVLDIAGDFKSKCNEQMVSLQPLTQAEDVQKLKALIDEHARLTGSSRAKQILDLWSDMQSKFIKVMPKDYERALKALEDVKRSGLSGDDAVMAAFEANAKDVSRVGGN